MRFFEANNKLFLFVLREMDFLVYEINQYNENSDNYLSFIKSFNNKEFKFFQNDVIKNFFVNIELELESNTEIIEIFFFTNREIKIFTYDLNQNIFIKKKSNVLVDKNNKCFLKLKSSKNIIIFTNINALIYNGLSMEYILKLNDDYINPIYSCKELDNNFLCFKLKYSVIILDLISHQIIGEVTDISPIAIKLVKKENKKYLLILTMGNLNFYEIEKFTLIQKLKIPNISNINKIKQITNSDIAILYESVNIAFYDIKKNVIKYKIINYSGDTYPCFLYNFFKEIAPNILLFNITKYKLKIINCITGQNIAVIKDGRNKIKRCYKIDIGYSKKKDRNNNDKSYILMNEKRYFIFKIIKNKGILSQIK